MRVLRKFTHDCGKLRFAMRLPSQQFNPRCTVLVLMLTLFTCGCASQGAPRPKAQLVSEANSFVDFSGSWELDYQLSDDLQDKLRQIFLMARLEAEREAARRSMGQPAGPVLNSPRNSYAGIIDLGRFAESISRTSILQIQQTEEFIQILREEDFSLLCGFYGGQAVPVDDLLGTELCGWDHHQLVFVTALQEGITIHHRLTMGPNRQRLNLATTVRSRQYPAPFTFNRVYQRFTPLPSEFECEITLDRGKSCRRVSTK